MANHTPGLEDMVSGAERELVKRNAVSSGDVVGIVAGTRTTSGSTNFMRLHMIGSGDDASVAKAIHSRTVAAKRAKTLAKKRSRRKLMSTT
jgi:pyruvate kinase